VQTGEPPLLYSIPSNKNEKRSAFCFKVYCGEITF